MNATEMKKKYDGMPLKTVARHHQRLRAKHDKVKAQNAETWSEVDYLRFILIPKLMTELGTDNIKLPGIGRVTVRTEASCSTLDKEALFEWLSQEGHDELMSNTVNSSTLKAFILNQLRDKEPIPGPDVIKFSTHEMAVINKN